MILFVNDTPMRFGTAFKKALKYHAVASLPTFIGGAIAAVALWIGLIEPALASLGGATGGPQQLLQAVIAAPINIPVLVVGVVGGLVVRRVGRTTLLFRIHGTGVVNTVEREVVPDQPSADRPASDEQSADGGSAGRSSATATSTSGYQSRRVTLPLGPSTVRSRWSSSAVTSSGSLSAVRGISRRTR